MKSELYLHHHLGLGDHIICNGLVRTLYKKYNKIILPTFPKNAPSVEYMYRDLPNLKINVVNSDIEASKNYKKYNFLRVGFENLTQPEWEKSFYEQLKINYIERYKSFFILRDKEREKRFISKLNLPKKYAFVSLSGSGNAHNISPETNLPVVTLQEKSDNLFDWLPVIFNAAELHTIDTSTFQLIKQLKLKGKKFFYDVRKIDPTRNPFFNLNNNTWNIITI